MGDSSTGVAATEESKGETVAPVSGVSGAQDSSSISLPTDASATTGESRSEGANESTTGSAGGNNPASRRVRFIKATDAQEAATGKRLSAIRDNNGHQSELGGTTGLPGEANVESGEGTAGLAVTPSGRKGKTGVPVAAGGDGGPSRPVFSGVQWAALEPNLLSFCHKVPLSSLMPAKRVTLILFLV